VNKEEGGYQTAAGAADLVVTSGRRIGLLTQARRAKKLSQNQ
jgi:hypothetical protein